MNTNQSPRPAAPSVAPGGQTPLPDTDDPRIVAAPEEYLAAIEAGARPNRQAFLARHADIAPALAESLDGMEALHLAASSSHPRALSPSEADRARTRPRRAWPAPGSPAPWGLASAPRWLSASNGRPRGRWTS